MTRALALRTLGYWCKLNGVFGADRAGQTALDAFVKPPRPNVTPKQAAFLATARRSTLRFDGEEIALYEWGPAEGRYVYTAYGFGYNAGRWRHFAPTITAAGYRLVAFDYIGHGHSSGTEIDLATLLGLHAAVLTHFGPPALALVHSFGAGTFACALARQPRGAWPGRIALLAPFSDANYIFRQVAEALGFGERHYRSLDRAVERRTGKPILAWDPAAEATALADLPALIAYDPADEVTAGTNALRLHAHWPNSHLLPSPGAGHGFTDEGITREILTWLLEGVLPKGAQAYSEDLARLDAETAHGDAKSAYFSKGVAALG